MYTDKFTQAKLKSSWKVQYWVFGLTYNHTDLATFTNYKLQTVVDLAIYAL